MNASTKSAKGHPAARVHPGPAPPTSAAQRRAALMLEVLAGLRSAAGRGGVADLGQSLLSVGTSGAPGPRGGLRTPSQGEVRGSPTPSPRARTSAGAQPARMPASSRPGAGDPARDGLAGRVTAGASGRQIATEQRRQVRVSETHDDGPCPPPGAPLVARQPSPRRGPGGPTDREW